MRERRKEGGSERRKEKRRAIKRGDWKKKRE